MFFVNLFLLSKFLVLRRIFSMQLCSFFSCLQVTAASTHTAACVGFVGWALAAVGVDALFGAFFYFIDFQFFINSNFYLPLVSADILLFRNYNKRNNLHDVVLILAYNFRTRKNIGKHQSAWFLLFYAHN